jgi:hypothetical protein
MRILFMLILISHVALCQDLQSEQKLKKLYWLAPGIVQIFLRK